MKYLPPDAPFSAFVARALEAIDAGVPWASIELARSLGGWTALVVVDGEPAHCRHGGTGIVVSDRAVHADVRCVATTRVILDLLHGRADLVQELESGGIELDGGIDAVISFDEVLRLFLHGAVRSRAFDDLRLSFEARAAIRSVSEWPMMTATTTIDRE